MDKINVIWFTDYVLAFDICIALPANANGPMKRYIDNGTVNIISEEDAKSINDKVMNGPYMNRAQLCLRLFRRWQIIAEMEHNLHQESDL